MGPCTANARRPTVDSGCRGTTVSCCVVSRVQSIRDFHVSVCLTVRRLSNSAIEIGRPAVARMLPMTSAARQDCDNDCAAELAPSQKSPCSALDRQQCYRPQAELYILSLLSRWCTLLPLRPDHHLRLVFSLTPLSRY